MSERWEKAIEEWYEKAHNPNLEYLDLATSDKVTNKNLAHNLECIWERISLLSRIHIKWQYKLSERFDVLEKELKTLRKAIISLDKDYISNKPLTISQIRELVLEIAEQPKLVEKEALKLTEDLSQKIQRVESLLHKLELWTIS